MKKLILFLIVLFSYQSSFAEISAANINSMKLEVNFGEKVTVFEVKKSGTEITLQSHSGNQNTSRIITEKDLKFLIEEFNKLPTANLPKECSRAKVEIKLSATDKPEINKQSCFGMNTRTQPAYVRFVNIFVTNR